MYLFFVTVFQLISQIQIKPDLSQITLISAFFFIIFRGVTCLIEETLTEVVAKYEKTLEEELEIFEEVALEEWEIIMPSKEDRTMSVIHKIVMERENSPGKCTACTKWMMEAIEIKESQRVNQLEVGSWTVDLGKVLNK